MEIHNGKKVGTHSGAYADTGADVQNPNQLYAENDRKEHVPDQHKIRSSKSDVVAGNGARGDICKRMVSVHMLPNECFGIMSIDLGSRSQLLP